MYTSHLGGPRAKRKKEILGHRQTGSSMCCCRQEQDDQPSRDDGTASGGKCDSPWKLNHQESFQIH